MDKPVSLDINAYFTPSTVGRIEGSIGKLTCTGIAINHLNMELVAVSVVAGSNAAKQLEGTVIQRSSFSFYPGEEGYHGSKTVYCFGKYKIFRGPLKKDSSRVNPIIQHTTLTASNSYIRSAEFALLPYSYMPYFNDEDLFDRMYVRINALVKCAVKREWIPRLFAASNGIENRSIRYCGHIAKKAHDRDTYFFAHGFSIAYMSNHAQSWEDLIKREVKHGSIKL